MRGKIGACGHPVRFVFNQMAVCLAHPNTCDTRPGGCGKCGSKRLYDFVSPFAPEGSKACRDCGHVVFAGY